MFGSSALEILIGIVLIYFMLALACTAFVEFFARLFDLRARTLTIWIKRVIDTRSNIDKSNPSIRNPFFEHPLIQGITGSKQHLVKGKTWDRMPSYIDPHMLSSVLIDLAKQKAPGDRTVFDNQNIQATIADALLLLDRLNFKATATTTLKQQLDSFQSGPAQKLLQYLTAHFQDKADIKAQLAEMVDSLPATVFNLLVPVEAGKDPALISQLRSGVAQIQNELIRKPLSDALESANGDIQKVRESLEVWFNESMDRVSGWYKRQMQWLTLALSALIVLASNADTLRLMQILQSNDLLRGQLVSAAEKITDKYTSSTDAANDLNGLTGIFTSTLTNTVGTSSTIGITNSGAPRLVINFTPIMTPSNSITDTQFITASQNAIAALNLLFTLPLGWDSEIQEERMLPAEQQMWNVIPKTVGKDELTFNFRVLVKVLGLLISIAALTLGAPFWFDMLSKIINIRSSGKKPGPETKSNEK